MYTIRVMADFASHFGCGRVLHYPLLFSPWKWFQWIPWPQKCR